MYVFLKNNYSIYFSNIIIIL